MSNDLNSILIEGTLKADPLYRVTPRGTPVCTFSIMSERYNRVDNNLQKEVGFFNVETWSKLAETCGEKGREGRSVRIVGRLREEHWTSLYGKLNSRVIIVAEHVEFRPEAKKEHGNEDGI